MNLNAHLWGRAGAACSSRVSLTAPAACQTNERHNISSRSLFFLRQSQTGVTRSQTDSINCEPPGSAWWGSLRWDSWRGKNPPRALPQIAHKMWHKNATKLANTPWHSHVSHSTIAMGNIYLRDYCACTKCIKWNKILEIELQHFTHNNATQLQK